MREAMSEHTGIGLTKSHILTLINTILRRKSFKMSDFEYLYSYICPNFRFFCRRQYRFDNSPTDTSSKRYRLKLAARA